MKRIPLIILVCTFVALAQNVNGQVTTGSNTPGPGVQYLGWNNSGTQKDLDITNNWQLRDINFTTNDGTTTAIRVKLQNDGNLGIGTTTPGQLLDVDGNINVSLDQWYGIDGNRILANEGTNNIFVGVGAGTANTTGSNNFFGGRDAGNSNNDGSNNTFLGTDAGASNDSADNNVFVGFRAGQQNTSGESNTYVGSESGALNDSVMNNVFVGFRSGALNTGSNNTFLGTDAGRVNEGNNTIAIGFRAAENSTGNEAIYIGGFAGDDATGRRNVVVGYAGGGDLTTGADNVFMGYLSGTKITTGESNTFVGHESGRSATTADANSFFGYRAGTNTTGASNTFIGFRAGLENITGESNTIVGHCAGEYIDGGVNNTFVGKLAGNDFNGTNSNGNTIVGLGAFGFTGACTEGSDLTLLGINTYACNGGTSVSNASAFGARAMVEADNSLVLGGITGINGGTSTNVGVGTTTPDNRLEVVKGTAGQSGLRLTSLAGSTAGSANGEVLSIDSNGDVILVEDGGAGFGNLCSATPEPLTGNYQLDFNDYNLYFTGSSTYSGTGVNTNGIGIGVACGGDVFGKLYIVQDQASFNNGSQNQALGATFNVTNTTAGDGVSIVGLSRAVRSNKNIGGDFYSGNAATINVGVEAKSRGTDGPSDINYGGLFFAEDADENIGVYGEASNGDTTGVGDWAGYFNGNVAATGVYYSLSDQTLKKDIVPLTSASEKLSQLNPVRYNFRTEQYPTINLSPRNQLGLLAQEVEQVVPQAVGNVAHPAQYDEEGNQISERIDLKGVNYTQLIPLLIAGFNEQQTQNAELNNRLQQLELQVQQLQDCIDQSRLCAEPQQRLSGEDEQSVVLENQSAIILDQNVPNPFAEQTRISFSIPEEVVNAEMIFFDMNGVIINQVQLVDRGNGSITVYGENLSSGVYSYSLIADGEVISTKSMVKN